MRRIVRALMLVVPLYAVSVVAFPDATPSAFAKGKKAKRAKKPAHREAAPEVDADGLPSGDAPAASVKVRKVTAALIVKWSKKGMSDGEIVSRAEAASFSATKKDLRLFKKKRLPSDLVDALGGTSAPVARAEPRAEPRTEVARAEPAGAPAVPVAHKPEPKVDLTKPAKIRDIDFDDVPPPPGSPEAIAQKQKKDQPRAEEPAKLDLSARPSAPFTEKAAAPEGGDAPRIRKPITPAD